MKGSSYLGSYTLEAVVKAAKILKSRLSKSRPRLTLQQTPPWTRLHLARCMNEIDQRLGCKAREKVVAARKNLVPDNFHSRSCLSSGRAIAETTPYPTYRFNCTSVMELRKFGDPLLRSRMPPLFSFLAPSVHSLWRSRTAFRQVRLPMPKSPGYHRSNFHTTARQHRENDSTAADLDFLEPPPPKPTKTSGPLSSERRPHGDILGSRLDSLLNSTFRAANPPANPRKSGQADTMSGRAFRADTMIENAFRDSIRKRDADKHYYDIAGKMQFPPQEMSGAGTSLGAPQSTEIIRRGARRATRTVRSSPSVGRAIEVVPERGMDVGRALKSLNKLCLRNKVAADVRSQRFHERPGMKRKRLKSQRWRRQFKASFQATVMRVKEMRRKGW